MIYVLYRVNQRDLSIANVALNIALITNIVVYRLVIFIVPT